jgi:hypothetical protein
MYQEREGQRTLLSRAGQETRGTLHFLSILFFLIPLDLHSQPPHIVFGFRGAIHVSDVTKRPVQLDKVCSLVHSRAGNSLQSQDCLLVGCDFVAGHGFS